MTTSPFDALLRPSLKSSTCARAGFQRLQVILDRRLVRGERPSDIPDWRISVKTSSLPAPFGTTRMDGNAGVERDVVIHDSERVARHESHPDRAERGVRDPVIAVSPDVGARQPCGPTRQVPRVGGELVDLDRRAGDVDADMLDVVHWTASPTRRLRNPGPKNRGEGLLDQPCAYVRVTQLLVRH